MCKCNAGTDCYDKTTAVEPPPNLLLYYLLTSGELGITAAELAFLYLLTSGELGTIPILLNRHNLHAYCD